MAFWRWIPKTSVLTLLHPQLMNSAQLVHPLRTETKFKSLWAASVVTAVFGCNRHDTARNMLLTTPKHHSWLSNHDEAILRLTALF